eukprot:1160137-Pelagomonas_calceolata.AAC.8
MDKRTTAKDSLLSGFDVRHAQLLVAPTAGPPFPKQKVAISCYLAYLTTPCTIPGPGKYQQGVAGCSVWAAGKFQNRHLAASLPLGAQ